MDEDIQSQLIDFSSRLQLPDRCLRHARKVLDSVPSTTLPPALPRHAIAAAAVLIGAALGREPVSHHAVAGQLGIAVDLIERAEAEIAERLDLDGLLRG